MKSLKKLLLVIAWSGLIAPAGAFNSSQLQAGDTVPSAQVFREITTLAGEAAQLSRGGGRLHGESAVNVAGPEALAVRTLPLPSAGKAEAGLYGSHAPAVPEPPGWMLLLSGLAVVACIIRRRTARP